MLPKRQILFMCGVATALLLTLGHLWATGQPAVGQPPAGATGQPALQPPGAATGRYQITSFVLPRLDTPGAYILDTQTGDVFQVVGREEPVRIGSVAKPGPQK